MTFVAWTRYETSSWRWIIRSPCAVLSDGTNQWTHRWTMQTFCGCAHVSRSRAWMPRRKRLLQNRAVAACITCHPGAIRTHGRWRSRPLSNLGQFTKFSHASHLNVSELSNCLHCHRVAGKSSSASLLTGMLAPQSPSSQMDFLPLTRESCSSCHRSGASGDNCTTCHRYHINLRNRGTISINH